MTPTPRVPTPKVRRLLLGGIVGPVAFVSAWAIAGAATSGYSTMDDAISDLAAVDASRASRAAMTAGFVVFGLGLIAFGIALRDVLDGAAWIAAVATGACTLGVAATPLGGWSGDGVHGGFAGLGYLTLVLVPLLAAPRLPARWRGVSIAVGVLAGASLVATTLGPAHGLWQRLGLTLVDAWIVATAVRLRAA